MPAIQPPPAMHSLADVYEFLHQHNQHDLNIQLIEPPSYLKAVLDGSETSSIAASISSSATAAATTANRRVIFLYKHQAATQSPATDASILARRDRLKAKAATSGYEVTGTPLEDDCVIETIDDSLLQQEVEGRRQWTDREECYHPIGADVARHYLNRVNALPCSAGSVWALCTGASDEPELLALAWHFRPDWYSRGFCEFTGLHHYRDLDVAEMRTQHLAHLRGPALRAAATIATRIEAHFDIQPRLQMRLAWDVSSGALTNSALCNYRKADIQLVQTIRMGSGSADSSVAEDYWRQLVRLDMIKSQIVAYRGSEDRSLLAYSTGSNLSLNSIRERVQRILTDMAPLPADDGMRGTAELEPVIKRALRRDLQEITDQLWMVLKLCSSYDDLKNAFNLIFQCAAKCNVVNTPTNNNHLAVLIRDIAQQRFAVPCLNGAEPLELLLEIGLEKALKDYEHIFADSQLCSAKEFAATGLSAAVAAKAAPAELATTNRQTMLLRNQRLAEDDADEVAGGRLGPQNSQFSRHASEQKLSRLASIHLLMEHLLAIQINLSWTDMHDYVMEDLRKPAKPLTNFQSVVNDKREISIACSKFVSKVEGAEPNLLRIRMITENKFTVVQNTFVFSTSPLFPTNVYPQMRMDELTLESPAYSGVRYVRLETRKQ